MPAMNEQDPALLPLGTKIDQYTVTRVLGRGGFGITYLVRDEGLDKDFALKEFFPEDLVRREGTSLRFTARPNSESDYRWGLKKFHDEARLLAQFHHANIVNVRRVFEFNNSAYMLLDFVNGSTLEKWLQGLDSPPTQEELDLISAPLLSALELVHANRTWHLDISPENVMIRSSDGAPILLDFGASRFEIKQHSQLVSALVFKSGYSAPEQYTSNAERYGPWTDVYAFGATLYRAISGSRPTEATSRQLRDEQRPAALVAKAVYRDKFLKAIDWAMKLSPDDRPQSIREWRQALLEGSQGTVAGGKGAVPMTRVLPGATVLLPGHERPGRQSSLGRRAGIAALAAVGLLLVVGLAADQLAPNHWLNPLSHIKTATSTQALPPPPSECGSEACWGVIVEKNGGVFARVKEGSREEAEAGALSLCARRLGPGGCRVLAVVSKKECWALAEMATDRNKWKAAPGDTLDEAKLLASNECERQYGTCRIDMTFCADGSHRVGGAD
jgi:tRNA A-37 threonylcarbamoyl transferase component Bud32